MAAVAVLSPVSLVLSHDLSILAAYGPSYEAALRATGHDARWTSTVQAVITVSALLGVLGFARLLVLWRTARRVERETRTPVRSDWRTYARIVLPMWAWLAVVTASWFLVQENLERLSIGQPLPGLGPLVGDGPMGPLLIIPAISLIVALVGSLFRWGIAALRARIVAAGAARVRRRPARIGRPAHTDAYRPKALSRNLGLRAPPAHLAA